jgi:hypothetical protein
MFAVGKLHTELTLLYQGSFKHQSHFYHHWEQKQVSITYYFEKDNTDVHTAHK